MRILKKDAPRPVLKKPIFTHMKNVNPSASGANVFAKILSVKKVEDALRNSEGKVLTEVLLGDSTASAILNLTDPKYDDLKAGDVVALRNLKVVVVKGFVRLEIDPWGKITKENFDIPEVNRDFNVSAILYELKQ